jgi:hypothetical protein
VKTCTGCSRSLPYSQFTKRSASSDGLTSRCSLCLKIAKRVWEAERRKSCADCGAVISRQGIRCYPCNGKTMRGQNHPQWKGGRWATEDGYVVLSAQHDHPNANKRGMLLEHIKVMSDVLGRPLYEGETVHHKNGVRSDNHPDNLELWVSFQPPGQRPEDLVVWAKEILRRYDNGGL